MALCNDQARQNACHQDAMLLGSSLKVNNHKLIRKLPYSLPSSMESEGSRIFFYFLGRVSLASQQADFSWLAGLY